MMDWQQEKDQKLGTNATIVATAASVILLIALMPAQAQTFTVIHSFSGPDGANPVAGLTIDRAGNLYGTTSGGGHTAQNCSTFGCGTVFKLTHAGSGWVLSELYQFNGSDGAGPNAKVVFGGDGSLYGTAGWVVFNLHPPAAACRSASCPWAQTVLYAFNGLIGDLTGDIAFDGAGNLYGTTYLGGDYHLCFGLGCGTVFQLNKQGDAWVENTLWEFHDEADGEYPNSGVIVDRAGNLYGTAPQNGIGESAGTVFEVSPSGSGWTFSVLYPFQCGSDGCHPWGGLILDGAGNLYGTTSSGGSGNGGTVFELSPSNGSWNFNLLYGIALAPGQTLPGPWAKLVMDSTGNLYGTTVKDGAYGFGNVFKLTPSNGSWAYTSLHDFTNGSDGGYPYDGLVMDANGNLYGTTEFGGNSSDGCANPYYQCGVVFQITQ